MLIKGAHGNLQGCFVNYQAIRMDFDAIDVDVSSEDCPHDALLIFDGSLVEEAEKRICGHWRDWEWITSDREAVVQLVSDMSDTYQGFDMSFWPIDIATIPGIIMLWNNFRSGIRAQTDRQHCHWLCHCHRHAFLILNQDIWQYIQDFAVIRGGQNSGTC